MARMAIRPNKVKVWYRGISYMLDLNVCRRALVDRQVDGALDSMESLANAVSISRSTASRYFSGRPTSLAVTLKILEALHLRFDEVAEVAAEDDDQSSQTDGTTKAGAARRPAPTGSRDGAAQRPNPTAKQ